MKRSLQAPLHFRRLETKYLVPERLVGRFLDRIAPYVEGDPYLKAEGKGRTHYPVLSLYFDSLDLQSLREKDAGLLSRRKLRLRTYEEGFSEKKPCFLEIKRRHDFIVSKDRLSLSVGHLNGIGQMSHLLGNLLGKVEASEAVTAEAQVLRGWYNLQPTALVRYSRMPFVARHDRKFRVTVDLRLEGAWRPMSLWESHLHACMPRFAIIELKCNHAVPAWFHEAIQDCNLTRVAHSKYALVVRSLHPHLAEYRGEPQDTRFYPLAV